MKMILCFVLCLAIVVPIVFSDQANNPSYEQFIEVPVQRDPRDFDTLLGRTFGTNKRSYSKKNFDEIDAAGFSDFNKRNFDEIDAAGFSDFNKRNFDEIDAAGFSDFNKRNFDEIDAAGFTGLTKKNFDEIDNAGFKDYLRKRKFKAGFNELAKRGASADAKAVDVVKDKDSVDHPKGGDVKCKKNFDEIDAAGFADFSKRSNDEKDCNKYNAVKAFLYAIKHKLHDDLAPYLAEYKEGKYHDYEPYYAGRDYGKYDDYYRVNKRAYLPFYSGYKVGKYDELNAYYPAYYSGRNGDYRANNLPFYNGKQGPFPPYYAPIYDEIEGAIPPYFQPYFDGKQGEYAPFNPAYYSNYMKYYKYKNAKNLGGYNHATYRHDEPHYYRAADSGLYDTKYKTEIPTTEPKTQP